MALIDKLTAVANAIRTKTGKSGSLTLEQMVTEISAIPVGSSGGVTLKSENKTITANGSDPYELTFAKTPIFLSFTTGVIHTVSGISLKCIGTVDFSSGTKVHTAFWSDTRTYCQIMSMIEGTKVTLYFLDQSGSAYLRNKTITVTGYYID